MSSTLLQLQEGQKSFGQKVLFEEAHFAVNEGEHIGVIGPNGAGKSTLLKILVGNESLDSGIVTKSNQLRLGYLEQESDWAIDCKVEDYLSANCIKPVWELKQFGNSLGLEEKHFQSQFKELSGGYRMRLKLLYLIGQEPNLLLLDEPTNFLDLETLIVLESFLQDYKGAFLLISHDREFLRRVTDHILEIESGNIVKFPGNLDDYFEQKNQLSEILRKQALSVAAKRKSILDFVTRFGAKATKARQAQSRLKSLEKLESIDQKAIPLRTTFQIPPASSTGKMILETENLSCGYEKKPILQRVNLRLERGHKLAIVGLNGAGKSTLLKSLGEQIPLLSGDLKWGHQVRFSYFAQHTPEALNPEHTVLEAMSDQTHPEVTQQDVLNMAGSLLFSGDSVHKKIHVLSGGEKSRVALGRILLQKSPLLLLDEPTNHLDFDTVESLTAALENYDGTIIAVSHDRGFIGRIANKILEVNKGELTLFPGSYDEYVWSLQKGFLSNRETQNLSEKLSDSPQSDGNKFNFKEERKKNELALRKIQKALVELERQLAELSTERELLNSKLIESKGDEAKRLAMSIYSIGKKIEALELEMLSAMEEQLNLENHLRKLLEGT